MTQYYLALISLPVIATGLLVLRIIISVKNPMYIGDDKKGNKKAKKIAKDSITVYSWEITKSHGFYREFVYKKRKNGKYVYKYSFLDLFCLIFPIIGFGLIYYIILYFNLKDIIEDPSIWVPFLSVLFVSLTELYVFINYAHFSARIYFRKWFKK